MQTFEQIISVVGFVLTIGVVVMIAIEQKQMTKHKEDILRNPEELYETAQRSLTRLFMYVVVAALWMYDFMMQVFNI